MPPHFLFKLILTPCLVAVATLAARQWGERIGGLLIGLPLTSGPVSIFFALEQGRTFAAHAAQGSILGLVAVAAFCVGYVTSARCLPWYLSALVSIPVYLLAIWGLSFVPPSLGLDAVFVPLVLLLAFLALGKMTAPPTSVVAPWWDLPLRMLVATAVLILITTLAGALGPRWSGLLSPFPIFTFVMATFSHSQAGPAAPWRLMRGLLAGLSSYVAFFVVVTLLVEQLDLVLVYTLATLAALAFNVLILAFMLRTARANGTSLQGG